MRPENFQFEGGIYFKHAGCDFDLHNNYYFTGFSYSIQDRKVEMRWARGTGEQDTRLPRILLLELNGIIYFSAIAGDTGMPFSDDDCIAEMSFLAPESSETEGVLTNGVNSTWHWVFLFQSGFCLRFAGESARLSTSES